MYLWACLGTVHDGMAPINTERILQFVQTFSGRCIT